VRALLTIAFFNEYTNILGIHSQNILKYFARMKNILEFLNSIRKTMFFATIQFIRQSFLLVSH
jgi:hypothetical protein